VLTITSLRNRLEAIRAQELQKAMSRLRDLTLAQREAITSMTTAIINEILQQTTSELMHHTIDLDSHVYCCILRRLFGLDDILPPTRVSVRPYWTAGASRPPS